MAKKYTLENNPSVSRYLNISTGHISKEDNALLARNDEDSCIICYRYDEGYFVHVSCEYINDDIDAMSKEGFSHEFINIMKRARELNCSYVQLDRDGMVYEDLPKFNW